MERRELTKPEDRQTARYLRDFHWDLLEKIAQHNPLYVCWWDKNGTHDPKRPRNKNGLPGDLLVLGLITSQEFFDCMRENRHTDWYTIGDWDEERYAAPVWITDQGREALANRDRYDMEPFYGGMVEPGYFVMPAAPITEDPT